MATPITKLEPTLVRDRVLEEVRGLLQELGSAGALPMLNGASQLERDLGLGSLERVELMARLENAFNVRIEDRAATQANTPDDLTAAVCAATKSAPESRGSSAARANALAPDGTLHDAGREQGEYKETEFKETEYTTSDDLAIESPHAELQETQQGSALRTSITAQKMRRQAEEAGVAQAETLLDVLRYRAAHDAERMHLVVTEDEAAGSENAIAEKSPAQNPAGKHSDAANSVRVNSAGTNSSRQDKSNRDKNITLTFGELYEASQRCASELARRGVSAGSSVALMLPTSRAFFVSYAGILLAGAIPVPIYPPFRPDRIEEYAARQSAILNNAGVYMLLTFRRAESVAKLLKPRVISLTAVVDAAKLIEAMPDTDPPAPGARPLHLTGARARKGSDIALLQYTSGSTGDPKGVVLTHANLLANIRAIGEAVEMGPRDVGASWLPLYHDMGLIGAWLTLLYYGIPLAVMSPIAFLRRPERWLWAIHNHRATMSTAPNFAYEMCVRKIADKDIEGLDLSSWRIAMNGAEPVNPETLERFATRFAKYGFRRESLMPVYGLAEASLAVTSPPLGRGPVVDRIDREIFAAQGRAVPAKAEDKNAIAFVSAGKPVPRHEICVMDESGKAMAERTEGFLWFRGPSATTGYYKNQKATEALFNVGPGRSGANGGQKSGGEFAWVNSGDRAYIADGELYVTGRVKDIIIKGGRNLYPHEVEELAARAEGIRKGCIVAFGIKDPASGTEKMIVVAESREADAAKRSSITAAVTDEISRGLGLPPDRVELIPVGSIPKTSSGKLRREETKQLFLAGTLSAGTAPAWVQIARLGASSAGRTAQRGIVSGSRRVLEILYGIYSVVVFSIWILPTWLMVQLFSDYRAAGKFTTAALRILFPLVGCKVRVIGKEYIDTPGAKIYAANHTSYFDVVALATGLGVPYRFVAKMEVTGMPFIGTFLRQMGHLAFDRTDAESRLHQAAEMEDILRKGDSVFVFPEGTFTRGEGVRQFQLGAFKAAVETGAPIIPVSLMGTREFLPDGAWLPRHSNVTITLSEPIYPKAIGTEGGGDGGTAAADWHELIRLRDSTREAVARNSGEPLL